MIGVDRIAGLAGDDEGSDEELLLDDNGLLEDADEGAAAEGEAE